MRRRKTFGKKVFESIEDIEVEVTLVRWFEVAAGGLMFICLIVSGFYVATERCRTRAVAVALLLVTLIAAGLAIAGIVLWILQVESPYYPAWSMGLSALASALVLITAMCLVPDIKENKYKPKSTVYPDQGSRYNRLEKSDSILSRDDGRSDKVIRRPSDVMVTSIGDTPRDYKKSGDLGREYGRQNRRESRNSADYNPYPYGPRSTKDPFNGGFDRFELEVITPSAPPRYDYMQKKY
ncbi:uncharacterized protein LOC134262554 [Saccostrea cucullata]|uniref:uncharacterized protein LOC134262554 n=1 Tax=Saccostrea cuccullata TaxID=36930 RepID=UPI002ED0B06E